MDVQRITVVDDSPEILDVLGDALRRDDVEVALLAAVASVDEIAETSPQLLMVDLRLGTDHLPGWHIVRDARDHPVLFDVPIIVCSGALDQMRAYGGSAVDPRTYLLPKPFSLDDLEAVMAEALGDVDEAGDTGPIMATMIPEFSHDPVAWFAWIESAMGRPAWRQIMPRIEPATWVSDRGHPWRLVRTTRGVEVRPDLVSPFLRFGNQPMVTAIGLSDEVEVELTTHQARWVDRFAPRTFDVRALGEAMLVERKLPHDNLVALFPTSRPERDPSPDSYSVFGVEVESARSITR